MESKLETEQKPDYHIIEISSNRRASPSHSSTNKFTYVLQQSIKNYQYIELIDFIINPSEFPDQDQKKLLILQINNGPKHSFIIGDKRGAYENKILDNRIRSIQVELLRVDNNELLDLNNGQVNISLKFSNKV
jgi:hypothetical protein